MFYIMLTGQGNGNQDSLSAARLVSTTHHRHGFGLVLLVITGNF
jgi:hypothetical protein